MTEAQLTYKLLKRLRFIVGTRGLVMKHNDRTNAGYPDFSVVLDGVTTWFECKVDKNKVTPIQAATLSRIRRAYTLRWINSCWLLSSWDGSARLYSGKTMEDLLKRIVILCEAP